MDASTITIRRFGPSGSLINRNIALEDNIDVMIKIRSEILFEMKYISTSMYNICDYIC